jgi:hypothetical protein
VLGEAQHALVPLRGAVEVSDDATVQAKASESRPRPGALTAASSC